LISIEIENFVCKLQFMKRSTSKDIGTPNPIDLHVGALVRKRRKDLGISQSDLANSVDLTFQQIQKYERGTNRISASKLHSIAEYLNVPVAYFFEGLPEHETEGEDPTERTVGRFLRTTEGQELAASFARLTSNKRKGVMSLVRSVISDEQD
jgi:transcriptional regulator with XRE-family HTH domain